MTLSGHLQTQEPPPQGLKDVEKRARQRAVRLQVFGAALLSIVPALIGLLGMATGSFVTQGATIDDHGNTLPGSSSTTETSHALIFYGPLAGIAIMLGAVIWSVLRLRKQRIPLLKPGKSPMAIFVLGVVILIASSIEIILLNR